MPRSRACRLLVGAYVLACIFALALVALSAPGIIARDPLSAVLAIFLSLPWSALASRLFDSPSVPLAMLIAVAGMVVNAWLLASLCGWISRAMGRGTGH